jgi:predicted protein tyrosine phosphatase
MNVLFICSRNQWRSRTAEEIFKDNGLHAVRSAGTEPGARIRVNEKMIQWADIIFVMEKRHRQRLQENFSESTNGKEHVILDPETRLWSLYWIASNVGKLDPPVVGSFDNNIGHFFCRDVYKGKNVMVVFRWDIRNKNRPIWSQAFSADEGKTWEWNWFNVSERIN